jgi:hypothetical protein
MPLSISSSKNTSPVVSTAEAPNQVALKRAIWVLVTSAVALYGCAEMAAGLGMERISKLHRRILTERKQAFGLRPAAAGQAPVILFVGNSLLLEGVDIPRLAAGLEGRYQPRRYGIEATGYLDWLYGLKGLFRDGARVDYVVLCLNPVDFTARGIRGDFSARVLFDVQDIWPVARATHADLTTTSGLYFAHYSMFYAYREELRGVLLGKISPNVVSAMQRSLWGRITVPPDEAMIPAMKERLLEMQQLCAANGAKFMFLIPPTQQPGDTAIVEAGRLTGVKVLHPVPNMSIGPDYYQEDQFHLNAKGNAYFTNALIETLRQRDQQ